MEKLISAPQQPHEVGIPAVPILQRRSLRPRGFYKLHSKPRNERLGLQTQVIWLQGPSLSPLYWLPLSLLVGFGGLDGKESHLPPGISARACTDWIESVPTNESLHSGPLGKCRGFSHLWAKWVRTAISAAFYIFLKENYAIESASIFP